MLNTQKLIGCYYGSEGKYAMLNIKNWEINDIPNNRFIKYPIHLIPSHMKIGNKVLVNRDNYEIINNIYTTKKETTYLLDKDGYILLDENNEVTEIIKTPEYDKELLALGDAKIGDEFHLHKSKILINEICDDFVINHIDFLNGSIMELNNNYALIEVNSLLLQYPKALLKKKGIKLKINDDVYIQGEEITKISDTEK